MRLLAAIVMIGMAAVVTAEPAGAQAREPAATRNALALSQPRHPRTKLRVRPLYPYRHYNSVYPVPYAVEYPGPNAKRDCVAHYVTENRPSGPVVVPRINCRWVSG